MDFEVDIDKMFSNFAPKKLIKVKNEIFSYWYDVAKAKSGQELRELVINIFNGKEIEYEDFSIVIYNIKKIEEVVKELGTALEDLLEKIKLDEESLNEINSVLFVDIYDMFLNYYDRNGIIISVENLVEKYRLTETEGSKAKEIYEEYVASKMGFFQWLFKEISTGLINGELTEKLKYYKFSIERAIFKDIAERILFEIENYMSIPDIDLSLANFLSENMEYINKNRVDRKSVV